jgi:hypothetical protein
MSEPSPFQDPSGKSAKTPDIPAADPKAKKYTPRDGSGAPRLIVRMWPKTPVLWPMGVAALICAILSHFYGAAQPAKKLAEFKVPTAVVSLEDGTPAPVEPLAQEDVSALREKFAKGYRFDCVVGLVFAAFFAYALFAVCIDFEVRWSLIAVAITIIAILITIITNIYYGFLPEFLSNILQLTPYASPQMYLAVFLIWFALMVVTLLVVRFHYVKIEANEVVIVGGFLEKQKRLSTFRMRYVKDVQDVMEYYLPFVRSGRLIFTFPGEEESIVIDNVHHIDRVIAELDKLSSRLNVEDFANANP